MSAPVTISGNEARLGGGAIWVGDGATVILPVDADISDNTATIVSHASNTRTTYGSWAFLDRQLAMPSTGLVFMSVLPYSTYRHVINLWPKHLTTR